MIRFLLVLLAFVSALLAFIFQETVLFVATGFLLLVSVVMLLLHMREQHKRKNRLKLPTDITPEDELKARGVLGVRPVTKRTDEATIDHTDSQYSPEVNAEKEDAARTSQATDAELRAAGISNVRVKSDSPFEETDQTSLFDPSQTEVEDKEVANDTTADNSASEPEPEPEREPVPEEKVASDDATSPVLQRRVEVDAHLAALQHSLAAHTACLIDVDTENFVYRLRSVVSAGAVDNAGTEYPFATFFLSELLAEISVVDVGENGLDSDKIGVIKAARDVRQIVVAPVMRDGLPTAFFVAAFEFVADEGCIDAVASAAEFFSSLYALQEDSIPAESLLAQATREPRPLRLVKSNPRSTQRKIISEEIARARGKSSPLALALVCLDTGPEIAKQDVRTIQEVEAWMRDCLESVTPDGRVEYFGQLGYGILQTRDVIDVEGWVRRTQIVFRNQDGPVKAVPVVGVAMLSDQHRSADEFQADAVRALRAAYECGDSTILVG